MSAVKHSFPFDLEPYILLIFDIDPPWFPSYPTWMRKDIITHGKTSLRELIIYYGGTMADITNQYSKPSGLNLGDSDEILQTSS